MFLYLNPVLYCDVSASWRFRSVGHKLVVAAAGIFVQLLLTNIGLTLWLFTGWSLILNFVIVNSVIAIFNFFPFIKLDGYWMLVHVFDEPNLRTKGLNEVKHSLRRLFVRREIAPSNPSSPLVLAYGFGHAAAIPLFWCLGLYGLYRWVSRASTSLAFVVVASFAGPLVYRAARSVITFKRSIVLESRRESCGHAA
jgi:putative peptide zinc metalloprotease protein